MAMLPKAVGDFVASNAKNVKINDDAIQHLAKTMTANMSNLLAITNSSFCDVPLHPKPRDVGAIDWIFIVDTLNFCFWTDDYKPQKWTVEGESGYFALCAAINRALRKHNVTNVDFYGKIDMETLGYILQGDCADAKIPLLHERVQHLHEVARVLHDKYNGTFETAVIAANGSALALLKIILADFPCYRDECAYRGRKLGFYKRAQILIADIWSCFHAKTQTDAMDLPKNFPSTAKISNEHFERLRVASDFHDIDSITMFADYRVPQVLAFYGCLTYTDELVSLLKRELLTYGCEEEVEIRGCSIKAVELLVEAVRREIEKNEISGLKEGKNAGKAIENIKVNAILIDQYLWTLRRDINEQLSDVPFHKVRCVFY